MSGKTSNKIIALISFGIFIIILIELILRVLGLHYSTLFFLEKKIADRKFLILNEHYMQQYFNIANFEIPKPLKYLFQKEKSKELYRIYMIGESTSQGFPCAKTESFPYQVQQMLNKANLNRKFEVVNLSITSINSYIALNIAKESLKYLPDMVIIYLGHNEFLGAGGTGEYNYLIFKLNKFFSKFSLYQVLKSIASKLGSTDKRALIEKMSSKRRVEYNSKLYYEVIEQFEKNYTKIIKLFRSRNIPVITCGVVKNLKDLNPFLSEPYKKDTLKKVIQAVQENKSQDKINNLINANAELYYRVGREYLYKGERDLAYLYFQKACDYDLLRFRAPSEINKIIKKASKLFNCMYINMQELFDRVASEGITGNDMLLEHIHPSLENHTYMAGLIADIVIREYFKQDVSDDYKVINLHSTLVEKINTAYLLRILFNRFPYNFDEDFNAKGFKPIFHISYKKGVPVLTLKPEIPQPDFNFIMNILNTEQSARDIIHVKYGAWLLREKNNIKQAVEEFITAYALNPFNYYAVNNLGVLYFKYIDQKTGAHLLYKVYRQTEDYIDCYKNLWLMLEKMGKSSEADIIKSRIIKMGDNIKGVNSFSIVDFNS